MMNLTSLLWLFPFGLVPIFGFIQVPPDGTGKQVDTATPGAGAHRQLIVVAGDQGSAEIARVLNTAPDTATAASLYGLVGRAILRRFGATLSTTNLGISGQFLQTWQEGNVEGSAFVAATARASHAGTIFIEETDDSADANFTRTVATLAVSATTTTPIYGVIRARYWRVRYDNGGTAQTTFKLTAAAGSMPAYATDVNGNLLTAPASGATFPVSAAALPLPTGASTETTLAGVKTGTDKIPASPSQEHTTAAAPHAARLTDGAAFYKPTTPTDTQPISAAALPLPAGAAQDATLTGGTQKAIVRGGAKGTTAAADATSTASGVNHQPVDVALYDASGNQLGLSATPVRTDPTGTTTQPISAASLPLPTGAATAAKQPALGTAGTPSVDVLSVQGEASMTPLKVDGSAVTQPVSGTVNANLKPATSGGCSDYHAVAAATTNAANVKASAGQIFSVSIFNNAAYPIFVKFHNTAGAPTAGTGVVHTIGIQAGVLGGWSNPNGLAFATGIGISIVKGIADADATAVALSDCVVDVQYA